MANPTHQVIAEAKHSIERWIGFTTTIGIAYAVFYTVVLIPSITLKMVLYALLFVFPPTALLVGYHVVLQNRRWRLAQECLERQAASADQVREAFKAIVEFPIKMPLFGFFCWMVGGLSGAGGLAYSTQGMLPLVDVSLMYLGVVSGAVLITIFQVYRWRLIVAPVVNLMVRRCMRAADDMGADCLRVPLLTMLTWTLLPFVVLSLFIIQMAGYIRAADVLQQWQARAQLAELQRPEVVEIITGLGSPNTHSRAVQALRNLTVAGQRQTYLLTVGTEGCREEVAGKPCLEVFPEVFVGQVTAAADTASQVRSLYNPYQAELSVVQRIPTRAAQAPTTSYLVLGFPWSKHTHWFGSFLAYSLVVTLVILLLAFYVTRVIAGDIMAPVQRLSVFTADIARGRIHTNVYFHALDELGELSINSLRMAQRLTHVLQRIQQASAGLEGAATDVSQVARPLSDGAVQQGEAIKLANGFMKEMDFSVKEVARSVGKLNVSARESAHSVKGMTGAAQVMDKSVVVLNGSIQDTAKSVEEMMANIKQVAASIRELSTAARNTTTAMQAMNGSIAEVQRHTSDTSQWSQAVKLDADEGVASVSRVRAEMHRIADVVQHAQDVMERLGERAMAIDNITLVINEITKKTNLLALNATIIAAQAGQHGHAFGVVADEIALLAARTTQSTQEIKNLITGVQRESRDALQSIADGARTVRSGVEVADQASASLEKISQSTRQALERIKAIAVSAATQSDSGQLTAKEVEKVNTMVGQIADATEEQARGSAQITGAVSHMQTASRQAATSITSQREQAQQILSAIQAVSQLADFINQAQQEQTTQSARVVAEMQRIIAVTDTNIQMANQLEKITRALTGEADTLRAEAAAFVIDDS